MLQWRCRSPCTDSRCKQLPLSVSSRGEIFQPPIVFSHLPIRMVREYLTEHMLSRLCSHTRQESILYIKIFQSSTRLWFRFHSSGRRPIKTLSQQTHSSATCGRKRFPFSTKDLGPLTVEHVCLSTQPRWPVKSSDLFDIGISIVE